MSPHPDESAPEPADRQLVRPYAPPSTPAPAAERAFGRAPEPPPGPAFAHVSEPSSGHSPEPVGGWPAGHAPAPAAAARPFPGTVLTAGPPAPGAVASAWPLDPAVGPATAPSGSGPLGGAGLERPARRGNRLPVAALALLALASAAGLLFLLRDPAPEPAPDAPHPGLALPALPARSPGAEDSAEPGAAPSSRAPSPVASGSGATASPSAGGRASGDPRSRPPGPGSSSAPVAKPPAGPSGTLRPGDRGPEVRALQERLYGQGFTYVSSNGVYDEQTRRGVAQLQRDRDIKGDPSGTYGPATRAAFG
ncbi:peptidoglycan-binding protein [Streptomyces sp. NPDC048551]|uniref:peptidoglycan-binding domain-containing protein n=1 Tax=Streptomyces sp. NPDC048551 TaxID=3155758 RepID=UPI00341C72E2